MNDSDERPIPSVDVYSKMMLNPRWTTVLGFFIFSISIAWCRSAAIENPAIPAKTDKRLAPYAGFVKAGIDSLNAGKLDDAYAEGEIASILEPEYFDAPNIMALALLKGGYERDGDDILGRVFSKMLSPEATALPGRGNPAAISNSSDSAVDKLVSKGLLYLTRDKFDKAMQAANAAIASDPSRYEGYALSSLVLRYKGDLAGAAEGLRNALSRAVGSKKAILDRLKVALLLPLGKSGTDHATWKLPEYVKNEGPAYPPELERYIRGEVTLVFLVDREGNVMSPFALEATRIEFVSPCLAAVGRWKFRPATVNGRSIPYFVMQPFIFD